MYGTREGIRTLKTWILSPIRMPIPSPEHIYLLFKPNEIIGFSRFNINIVFLLCMVGVSGIEPPSSKMDTD